MSIRDILQKLLSEEAFKEIEWHVEHTRYLINKNRSAAGRERFLKKWFEKYVGYPLNLDNPQTYNEKIQWTKLYGATPKRAMLSDKEAVRDFIAEEIGEEYLIPLLGAWDSFDEIDFDKLPDKFVLKTNHGSGWNYIVKDKSTFNKKDAKKKFDRWLKTNYAYFSRYELHYDTIKPRIIAEQYMENDGELLDYKFVCFGGKVEYIWVDWGRFSVHKRNIYDVDWNRQDYSLGYPYDPDYINEKPVQFENMLSLAKKLSEPFAHVRVDFYEIDGHIYFGELTFTSGSGNDRFDPVSYDKVWGEKFVLPKEKHTDK